MTDPPPVPVSFAEPRFHLTEQQLDERSTIIGVAGEIHVSTAPQFSERLNKVIAEGRTSLVLDMSDVEFIDSTGLSVLLNALRRVTRAGGRLVLVCSNPTVLRLFEITRLDSTFEIVPKVGSAIAAVQASADGSDSGMP